MDGMDLAFTGGLWGVGVWVALSLARFRKERVELWDSLGPSHFSLVALSYGHFLGVILDFLKNYFGGFTFFRARESCSLRNGIYFVCMCTASCMCVHVCACGCRCMCVCICMCMWEGGWAWESDSKGGKTRMTGTHVQSPFCTEVQWKP